MKDQKYKNLKNVTQFLIISDHDNLITVQSSVEFLLIRVIQAKKICNGHKGLVFSFIRHERTGLRGAFFLFSGNLLGVRMIK